jgi:16S rRNA (guanine966-N2)-methyltransferase
MRIIAGQARGLRLEAPKTLHVRPTQDRIRESLFSILTPRLDQAQFLDLFAGTGANGIEALSRGAATATFVDHDERSLQFIKRNLARASLKEKGHVRRLLVPEQLGRLVEGDPFDIVFADPPYKFTHYRKLLTKLLEERLVSDAGVIVIEHARRAELPEAVDGWSQTRQNTYGDTRLTFYARSEGGVTTTGGGAIPT